MKYYCHWCKKELVGPVKGIDYDSKDDIEFRFFGKSEPLFENTWNLSCPDYHAMIKLEDNQIVKYKAFVFLENKRYEILGYLKENIKSPVSRTLLYGKLGRHYTVASSIPKFIPLYTNEDNVLLIEPILDKLKKYVIFT